MGEIADMMIDKSYKALVLRYAQGRIICNCGQAYSGPKGECTFGCSANQYSAKLEIATKALAEIESLEQDVGRYPVAEPT